VSRFDSSKIKTNLELRAAIMAAIRFYFADKGYLEVETPNRIPAPAPETHIEAQASGSWFLHTSPELCMKRLLSDGFERIFQICKCYRKGERGRLHLPEMTMLEWYTAEHDYRDMMQQCQDLICAVARSLGNEKVIQYQGQRIDITGDWERMTVDQAFEQFASEPLDTAIQSGHFDEIIGCDIAPKLGVEKPVFLFDYPAALGSLARLKPGNTRVAERFELYIAGIEICNAFSELTDPAEQQERFNAEISQRRSSGKTVYPRPDSFLQALAAMPESAGNALGIDRLVMLFADASDIDEVVAFTPESC
jgi:lysyl-tRNA synthetase class 2